MKRFCFQEDQPSRNVGLDDCSFQLITIAGNVFWIVLVLVLLAYRRWCGNQVGSVGSLKRSRPRSRNQTLQQRSGRKFFQHHNAIWILTIILYLALMTEFSEAIIVFFSEAVSVTSATPKVTFDLNGANSTKSVPQISDEVLKPSLYGIHHFRFWSPVLSITSLTLISVLYHAAEFTQDFKYLMTNLSFFIYLSVLSIAKLEFHLRHDLTLVHVKVLSEICSGIGAMTLVLLLLHILMTSTRQRKKHDGGGELKNVQYLHYYCALPSRLTFYWFTSLLRRGYKHPLEEEDLGNLPPEEKSNFQFDRFNRSYQAEKEKASVEKPLSLWYCMFKTLWSSLLVAGVFRLVADLFGFVAPLGLGSIVEFVTDNNVSSVHDWSRDPVVHDLTLSQLLANGYVMAFVILLSAIFQSTFSQCSTFLVNLEGIRMKVALQALIFKKSLTLAPTKSSAGAGITSADSDPAKDKTSSKKSDKKNDAGAESVSDDGKNSSTGFDSGSIVHIVSEDTTNVMTFFWMVHFIWAIPLKLAILMILLYLQLGYSALIGAAICIFLMIPIQFWIGKKMSVNSREMMERCDERLRSMSEILQGMKLLKVHGWEIIFSNHLSAIREKELVNLDRDLLYRSIMTFLTHISSVLVTVVTFGLYPYLENEKMEPSKVFAGLALFNQLTVPLFIFPITVPVIIDAMVSVKRIATFLLLPETSSLINPFEDLDVEENSPSPDKDSVELSSASSRNPSSLKVPCKTSDLQTSNDSVFGPIHEEDEDEDDWDDCGCGDDEAKVMEPLQATQNFGSVEETLEEVFVKSEAKLLGSNANARPNSSRRLSSDVATLTNCDFSWEEDRHDNTLVDITTRIPKGKLTVIVGSVGSGKSSIIAGILGEIRLMKGEVSWASDARVAYAAQQSWIINGSIRDNILFGKQFRPRRYKKVIDACSLQGDLDILPAKDFTEIGEKGINLSGGQKQRIGIARALYHFRANVIILDDVLSALDVEVAQEVFNTGIMKYLVKAGKTVLLATHHLPVLTSADHIIALDKGRIRIQGKLSEIKKADVSLYSEWQRIISKKEAKKNKLSLLARTGKERWALLKLVSKIGLQLKNKNMEGPWRHEDDVKPILERYRKKQASFSAYRNLSHDMFLPNDDCCHDEIMTPLLRCRTISRQSRLSRDSRASASSNTRTQQPAQAQSGGKHLKLARMTSLQVDDLPPRKGQKVIRLQSLPVTDDIHQCPNPQAEAVRERADTLDSPLTQRPNFFKRLLSVNARRTLSSDSTVTELDKLPRLLSTLSTSESEYPEEEENPEYALLAREMSSDEREYGTIPVKVHLSYISACGWCLSAFYLLFAIGYEVIRVCTNFWLKEWSDEISVSSDDDYDSVMEHYFNIYVILSVVTVLVSLSSNLIGKQAGANSREALHSKMLKRIVRCPMKFFDTTPIGRILNRFSSDVTVVDRKLCISMQRFLQFVFLCMSAIVVNALVNPWFLIVAIPIVGIYYYIQRFYRFSSRELQRIEAISRGPIYTHFHETLEGLSIIRAFQVEKRFTEDMFSKIDTNNTAAIFINVGNRWLSISLDYLGSLIVYLATLVSMISSYLYPEHVTPSMVGLAINYTLLVPVYLNWVVKFLAEVEMFMTSVDRIDRYSAVTVEDYGDDCPNSGVPKDWPSSGHVQFDNVSVQYAIDRPRIIHNLNLDVSGKQKVGICGRSGSGKSSLLMSLFRIADVCEGKILVDGVDISKIPLLKLRSSLSIIPQENILFSGTVRFNLDPNGNVSDAEIWKALELSQMKDFVQDMPGQLDAEIKDGGSSFSAGQKQLLGLARAILHNSKVVILDEATSSVDLATEKIILGVVKEAFKDSTVLTIAHRLDTIVDGDRVIVLDAGVVVEDGNPTELQRNPNSIFKSMMQLANEQGHLL